MRWTKDELEQLLNESVSTHQIAERSGCSQATVLRWLKKYGLRSTCPSGPRPGPDKQESCVRCGTSLRGRAGLKFCSLACSSRYVSDDTVRLWLAGQHDGCMGMQKVLCKPVRSYILERAGYACESCGWNRVHPVTGRPPLDIHHVDGDPTNHKLDNLQVLCPCCHALTPTYKALNNGNGKPNRYKGR